jgi:hypothetical protein
MKFTKSDTLKIGNKLKIDWKKISFNEFYMGINVELEHGLKYKRYGTNITNDNPLMTGKIALIHIIEVPDYYTKLKKYVDPGY